MSTARFDPPKAKIKPAERSQPSVSRTPGGRTKEYTVTPTLEHRHKRPRHTQLPSMPEFTTLPSALQTVVYSFLTGNEMLSSASTRKDVRGHALECLSKRVPTNEIAGLVRCRRRGPYLHEVNIIVDGTTVKDLGRLMRWVEGLHRLEILTVSQPHLAFRYSNSVPCTNWAWLSVVSAALRRGRARLPHLQAVWLGVYMRRINLVNQTANSSHIIPALPPHLLYEFVSSLPPGLKDLRFGPHESFEQRTCGLAPDAYAGLLRLLETNVLPGLTALTARVEMDQTVFDALVSMLRRAPFAKNLETLIVDDNTSAPYAGPPDLAPLVYALARCPKLKEFVMGNGHCDARHLFTLMDLIIDGTMTAPLQPITAGLLPVRIASSEQMGLLVDKLTAALLAGRLGHHVFFDLQQAEPGQDSFLRPVPDAALGHFLSATREVKLPELYAIRVHVSPGPNPSLELLPDWLKAHRSIRAAFLNMGAVRGRDDEIMPLRALQQVMLSPELVPLEFMNITMEVCPPLPGGKGLRAAIAHNHDEETAGQSPTESDKATQGKCPHTGVKDFCCVLKATEMAVSSALSPPPGTVREIFVQYTRPLLPGDDQGQQYPFQNREVVEHNLFCTSAQPVKTFLGMMLRSGERSSSTTLAYAEVHADTDSEGHDIAFPLANPAHDQEKLDRARAWIGPGKWRRLFVDWRYRIEPSGRIRHWIQSFVLESKK